MDAEGVGKKGKIKGQKILALHLPSWIKQQVEELSWCKESFRQIAGMGQGEHNLQ